MPSRHLLSNINCCYFKPSIEKLLKIRINDLIFRTLLVLEQCKFKNRKGTLLVLAYF